jgi:hypothetical protein
MERQSQRSERGAILIHVALAMVVLIAFTTFVVDYGVMWVGRRQAQNAADAGALAGAVAMAFDANGWTDRTPTGPARAAALQLALANWVWGQSPSVNVVTDVYFTNTPADMCPQDANGLSPCIRVDVYRDQVHGSALPAIFGLAVGLVSQDVRATATARVAIANASDCLKPWAIPDKWLDYHDVTNPIETNPPAWTSDDAYETLDQQGNPVAPPDVYVPASPSSPGTGFTVPADIGTMVVLKQGGPQTSLSPGVFEPVRIPSFTCSDPTGANCYQESIEMCNGLPIAVGDTLQSENGNMIGPTSHGVQNLIAQDPTATWDPSTNSVVNSCAQGSPACGPSSPRVVAVPVFDTATYYTTKRQGVPVFTIVNILGFFIDQMQGNNVVGYLTEAPGLTVGSAPSLDPNASFLTQIQLIR